MYCPLFCVYLSTVEKANNIHICLSNTAFGWLLHAFSYINFRQRHQSGEAEPVGEHKETNWVSRLDGRIICVQVLQESQKTLISRVQDFNLYNRMQRLS